MNIKLIIILVFIYLAASCGKAKKQSIDEGKSNDTMQEHILGSWSVKSDTNMVLRNLDTLLITSSDKKLNIKLRRDKTITFDSVTFLKNKMQYHITKNDTTRYYEFQLSNDTTQLTGGTAEGWNGRTQEIELTKLD